MIFEDFEIDEVHVRTSLHFFIPTVLRNTTLFLCFPRLFINLLLLSAVSHYQNNSL
jgi:hypothetical protein